LPGRSRPWPPPSACACSWTDTHLWESWGKNLNEYLGAVYDGQARFCVVLISQEYCGKAYTNLERRRALDGALGIRTEYILAVLLDNSWLDGLPRATVYMDLRQMTASEVGRALVRKVTDADASIVEPAGTAGPSIVPDATVDVSNLPRCVRQGPLEFAAIGIAPECKGWKLDDRQAPDGSILFRGSFAGYVDPIFDIVVVDRGDRPVLLSAVGIEAVQLGCEGVLDLGGGGAGPLNLHRTYQLPLPDLWQALARRKRAVAQGAPADAPLATSTTALPKSTCTSWR
jgi:hypothetical protein